MLIFYPILYNGKPATMVNLSNVHFGVYCIGDDCPVNLCLNQLRHIKTGKKLSKLRITYEKKHRKPVEIIFFSLADREEFLQNLIDAKLIDKTRWCCYILLPFFLFRLCCGLFRYNQLYIRSRKRMNEPNK